MSTDSDRFFVLTGGPGSGKTTLIEALRDSGHVSSVEAGRGIIQQHMAISGPVLPWNDPALFAETMLSWEMRSHAIARDEDGIVFFDRGVPDIAGYLKLSGLPVPAHVGKAAEIFRYNRKVFVLPPWPEIFTQDAERRQDLDEARRTFEAVSHAYEACGYELVAVPPASVEERRRFVLAEVGAST
ncbi:AAA family ATPase [Aquamicrobium sp. LC103]|uniref:AAA family ATPase n=1 Tax=Aquamicrobium sp. LC103 TaxID=1120658 RepID=UPI00063ECC59|nr:AAA family ATPase [Aquamicrobium sp. LC103]TKT80117.1 ATPase [Aquamicrobium sp. LC103]